MSKDFIKSHHRNATFLAMRSYFMGLAICLREKAEAKLGGGRRAVSGGATSSFPPLPAEGEVKSAAHTL